jgi:hypothetical protein
VSVWAAAVSNNAHSGIMRVILSRGSVVEAVEKAVEDLLAADLSFGCGVVSLAAEGGFELDGGDEEDAGLADGFEVAVEAGNHASSGVAR